jgi:hypothetical protein
MWVLGKYILKYVYYVHMFSNVVILDVNMFGLVIEDKKEKIKWWSGKREAFLCLISIACKEW